MNILEVLNNSRYSTQAEWALDIADSRYNSDPEFRNAVTNKLKRSFKSMSGVQAGPAAPQSMSFQQLPDGFVVGNAAQVAKAIVQTQAHEDEAETRHSSFMSPGQTSNFRPKR